MDPVIDVCLNSLRKKGNKASQCFEALRRMADCGIIVRGEKLTKEAAEIAIHFSFLKKRLQRSPRARQTVEVYTPQMHADTTLCDRL